MLKKFKLHFNWIPIIIIAALILKAVFSIELIFSGFFSDIISILMPFFWAFGIAYLLNPLMLLFERKLKLKRSLSILLTYIVTILVFVFLILVIVPTIFNSLSDLTDNITSYMHTAESFINEFFSEFHKSSPEISQKLEASVVDTIKALSSAFASLAGSFVGQTIAFTSSFIKFIFGFIISIYMLSQKDILIGFVKKMINAMLPTNKSNFTLEFLSESNYLFSRFIVGKTIDSTIIGIMCYVGLLLMQAPFAALIALIVGITNMIPYFGPFIGMVPAFVLTLFVSPTMAIWVLIFIFLLQQFDGWYLGPKILGDKVGVSPLLIIFAVTVGGGVGGLLGMFISVPIAALIRNYLDRYFDYKLKQKEKAEIDELEKTL
ncbi:AI-2E family transporter [uncultured Clostridium sp.]|uniref:AI-2E family transporter n=1 Tax=uncultured Clostridium sp. TaxID=59620 RepID=UPI00262C7D70|nr:AI-2E family transporter [uncultured Clostridium sp.]